MFKEIRASLALRIAALLLGTIGSILIARLGGPDVKGVSSAFAAASAIGFMVINFDSGQMALRFARDKDDSSAAWNVLAKVWVFYSALVPVALVFLIYFEVPLGWYILGAIAFGMSAQAGVVSVGYKGPLVGSAGAATQQAVLIAAVLLFAVFSSLDIFSVKIVILVSYIAPLPIYVFNLPKSDRFSSTGFRQVFGLLVRSVPWQLGRQAQTLLQKMDVLLVFALLGASQSGIYSVGVSTAMLVQLVPAQFASQTLFDISSKRSGRTGNRSLAALVSGGLTALPLALGGYWFIEIAYGSEFSSSYIVLLTCIPGAVAYGVLQVQSNYIRLLSTWKVFFVVNGVGSLLMAICLFLMVALADWTLVGPGLAFSVGTIIAVLLGTVLIKSYGIGSGATGD